VRKLEENLPLDDVDDVEEESSLCEALEPVRTTETVFLRHPSNGERLTGSVKNPMRYALGTAMRGRFPGGNINALAEIGWREGARR